MTLTPLTSRTAGETQPGAEWETVGIAAGSSEGGVGVNCGAANVKGAWTELGTSASSFDGFWLAVTPGNASRDYLLDLAFGAAGSEVVQVANLLVSAPNNASFTDMLLVYVPLAAAGGTRIAARAQSNGAAGVLIVGAYLGSGDALARLTCASSDTYGAVTGDSGGTSIDPGAVANADGAWTQLSAAVAGELDYAVVCVGNQQNTARVDASYRVQLGEGGAGSEAAVIPGMAFRASANDDCLNPSYFPLPVLVTDGARLAARGRSNITDATDRLFDVVVVGFTR